jgi:hypothetical protein
MANRVNNWRKLLNLANKDLNPQKVRINANSNSDGTYSVEIVYNGKAECYAEGYYEDELGDLINDAWAHAKAKEKSNVEKLVDAYFELSDAEKDEFLRLTDNQ